MFPNGRWAAEPDDWDPPGVAKSRGNDAVPETVAICITRRPSSLDATASCSAESRELKLAVYLSRCKGRGRQLTNFNLTPIGQSQVPVLDGKSHP
ncbi:hypothetical protein M514_11663 [Trichuris suis]|uniref:Uncharacterized protein n=1 Tax=Trichuris suis TaxID=68888 RepID=A0A085MTT5_9BILA|nr:hypothetical protein M513_11663 [Trichuris suis]KFD60631.1 hypothetical protein M514_11663 [Trichuris suis]